MLVLFGYWKVVRLFYVARAIQRLRLMMVIVEKMGLCSGRVYLLDRPFDTISTNEM